MIQLKHSPAALILLAAAAAPAHGASHTAHPQMGSSAAFDHAGNLWLVARDSDGLLALRKSADAGARWSAPRTISKDHVVASGDERPRLVFGPHDEMYVTYSSPLALPYTSEVRFIHSEDGGAHFSAPLTVHQDRQVITHGFASMIVDAQGRIFITWIDKRDLQHAKDSGAGYSGAAQYYAVSTDGGQTFNGDYKVADHTCECCRSAVALDRDGWATMMWRHVFAPNYRDHAMVELRADGRPGALRRASFDHWAIDACPHQGPAMAFAADGRRHQTWFTGTGLYYAHDTADGQLGAVRQLGGEQAAYADIAVSGQRVEVAWKEFDGVATLIKAISSHDAGATWTAHDLASTSGASDQPRLVKNADRIFLVWSTEADGIKTMELKGGQP